jgi:hypothetical protein
MYHNKVGFYYCLKMEVVDPSDSQRGHSSTNHVYLIILMVPYQDKIHINLQSIGYYVLHQRMVKFK